MYFMYFFTESLKCQRWKQLKSSLLDWSFREVDFPPNIVRAAVQIYFACHGQKLWPIDFDF